jgi:nucleotide-binding universal stress UspA family protein
VSKLHRVLAAVDFSEPARVAFDHALALSRLHDAELLVVHAVPTDRPFKWHARERIALIGALRSAAQTAGVRFKVSVQHGDPAGVIMLHANARHADLIVLGTSKRAGFDRFRFGSVAETVAREAIQPVLVVPATAAEAADPMTPFKNILVAVDFGEGSNAAVERALSMATGDSKVTVVHVIRGVPFERSYRYPYKLMEPEYQRNLARVAWRRMGSIVPANATTGRKVHARVVTGEPTAEIARVAAEVDADLIMVGVTARGPIGRLIMGSTAARVIRSAGRPVLAIPQRAGKAAAPVRKVRMPMAA